MLKTIYSNFKKHRIFFFFIVLCGLQEAHPFEKKEYYLKKLHFLLVVLFANTNFIIRILIHDLKVFLLYKSEVNRIQAFSCVLNNNPYFGV